MDGRKRIKKLDEAVINRIAAGEIINRPENVVKELIENSLDAGSSQVSVAVKDGGLKQLVISDNGKGIQKDDFPLVCQRFCTSKLQDFSDLKSIQSYGFRGEALASVSHVAHVTVISRTNDSPCAFKGVYSDGILVQPGSGAAKSKSKILVQPKPIAGNIGTQIFVEDLFYNIPIRKAAFKNVLEEYNRILGVVQKYSILNSSVSFSCKKVGSNQSDLQTSVNASQLDNIRNIYGDAVAKELLKFEHDSSSTPTADYSFKASGFLSNPNFSIKKKEFIIFINNRLVECPSIRKSLDTIYAKYLPKTACYSFIFLSVSIPPASIDVNVHPTKKQVHFLHEDEIIIELSNAVDAVLTNADQSRVFSVPRPITFVHTSTKPHTNIQSVISSFGAPGGLARPGSGGLVKPKAHLMVRTDSRTRTLDSFFSQSGGGGSGSRPSPGPSELPLSHTHVEKKPRIADVDGTGLGLDNSRSRYELREIEDVIDIGDDGDDKLDFVFDSDHESVEEFGSQQPPSLVEAGIVENEIAANAILHDSVVDDGFIETAEKEQPVDEVDELMDEEVSIAEMEEEEIVKQRPFVTVELDSVVSLRQELSKRQCETITSILQNHTFVGCFDTHLALIQHNTSLLVVEVPWISRDFMYQVALYGFSNFGLIPVDPGVDLVELILLGLEQRGEEWKNVIEQMVVDKDTDCARQLLARKVADAIVEMRFMLEEYFSIIVDENGTITALPNMIPGYLPNLEKLAVFILDLGGSVDYSSEKECFEGVCRVLAEFYAFTGISDGQSEEDYYHQVQHFLFAELGNCIGLRSWTATQADPDGKDSILLSRLPCIREVANLQELYKIFERC